MKKVHLCRNCAKEYPECNGDPKFSIDFNSKLKGKDADRVVSCGGYVPR